MTGAWVETDSKPFEVPIDLALRAQSRCSSLQVVGVRRVKCT